MSADFEKNSTSSLVADKADNIAEIIPRRLTYADSAGMILRIAHGVTGAEFREKMRVVLR